MPKNSFLRAGSIAVTLPLVFILMTACAGPTSPFGSVLGSEKSERQEHNSQADKSDQDYGVSLIFMPQRQVLHSSSDFGLKIIDTQGITLSHKINVFFNGLDVTETFLAESETHMSIDGKIIDYTFPHLHLKAWQKNKIQVSYRREPFAKNIVKNYQPPSCRMSLGTPIQNTNPFSPKEDILDLIELVSGFYQLNPSLIAALVAQESGFDPQAVSWAKAIGLTQVTTIAEKEILPNFKHWPRFKGLSNMGYLTAKRRIHSGEINSQNEWRLDPEKSIEGGVFFLKHLKKYWKQPENLSLLSSLGLDTEENKLQVLLASYNSGAARVKYALAQFGNSYLWNSDSLFEARKYVRRISSYCYHFAQNDSILSVGL